MDLKETVDMMLSVDYKERFRAEYRQTAIRYQRLKNMLKSWDEGRLGFTPTCPRSMYDEQIDAMEKYIGVLEERACLENIMI